MRRKYKVLSAFCWNISIPSGTNYVIQVEYYINSMYILYLNCSFMRNCGFFLTKGALKRSTTAWQIIEPRSVVFLKGCPEASLFLAKLQGPPSEMVPRLAGSTQREQMSSNTIQYNHNGTKGFVCQLCPTANIDNTCLSNGQHTTNTSSQTNHMFIPHKHRLTSNNLDLGQKIVAPK